MLRPVRPSHRDHYADTICEAGATVETLDLARRIDARRDTELARARRIMSLYRAQHQSAEASLVLQLVTDRLTSAAECDALIDERVFVESPARQRVIAAVGRAGMADCEAGR